MKRNYTFVITKGVDGYFIAEIFSRVKEAIEVYLEAVEQENKSILDKVEFVGVNQIEVEIG